MDRCPSRGRRFSRRCPFVAANPDPDTDHDDDHDSSTNYDAAIAAGTANYDATRAGRTAALRIRWQRVLRSCLWMGDRRVISAGP